MPTGIKEKILPTKRHKLVHYQLSKVSSFHIRKSLVYFLLLIVQRGPLLLPTTTFTPTENVVQGQRLSIGTIEAVASIHNLSTRRPACALKIQQY